MKRVEPEQLGDVLRQTIEDQGLTVRLLESKACAIWPAIVGEEIAALTSRPYVANGVMTIHVKTPSLRQELNMTRSRIAFHINEAVGRQVISEVRFK